MHFSRTFFPLIPFLFFAACITDTGVEMLQEPQKTPEESFRLIDSDPLSELPRTQQEILQAKESLMTLTKEEVGELTKSLTSKSSFEESFGEFDRLRTRAVNRLHQLMLLELLHPQREVQKKASRAVQSLRTSILENFDGNKDLYDKLKNLERHLTAITKVEKHFITSTLRNFERNGMHLSASKRLRLKALAGDIQRLSSEFDGNIQHANSFAECSIAELEGLDPSFIENLESTKHKKKITTDYPTYRTVMNRAKSSETRRKTYSAFMSRAYPKNYEILTQLVKKRHELARLLGFKDYSHFDLDSEMAKSPSRVLKLLKEIQRASLKRAKEELRTLTRILPQEVPISDRGKVSPWDFNYLYERYKNQRYQIDTEKVSEYFPMEKTMAGLLELYSKVFSLEIKEVPSTNKVWHKSVRTVEISKDSNFLGTVYLDLHPRENKYNHARVLSLSPSQGTPGNRNYTPGAIVIIANNSQATEEKPALFSHGEVSTFFHEFGHALHGILTHTKLSFLSSSEMAMTYGLPVKTDFVEVPSTIFEKWLENEDVLESLSSHYITGEKLPKETIKKLIDVNHIAEGILTMKTACLAEFSLKLFSSSRPNVHKLYEDCVQPFYELFARVSHAPYPASFLHLTSYGAKYYSYLWSGIYSEDLFTRFKEDPLNPEVGAEFRDKILTKGASAEPEDLLFSFLKRKPNSKAFFKALKTTL